MSKPSFLSGFTDKTDKPLKKQIAEASNPGRMGFTARDHQTLTVILTHPVQEGSIYCEISNSRLGKALSITTGAAAARVARLIKLGIIKAWYEASVNTGKVNKRVLEVIEVPDKPWSPT